MTTERASSIQGVIARDSIVARRRPIADFFNSIDPDPVISPSGPVHRNTSIQNSPSRSLMQKGFSL
jgi:hypothetical protein